MRPEPRRRRPASVDVDARPEPITKEAATIMLHLGLDLSRKHLDVCVLDEGGEKLAVTAISPDADGLRHLACEISHFGVPVRAAIESMNGARFVHDTLELCGFNVEFETHFTMAAVAA